MPISRDHTTLHIIELNRLLKWYVMIYLCEFIIIALWSCNNIIIFIDVQGTNSTNDTSIILTELIGDSDYIIEVIKI